MKIVVIGGSGLIGKACQEPSSAGPRGSGDIAQSATEGQTVRLPPVLMQPIVSDDVAAVMADVALAAPLNGTVDLAGPEPIREDDLVRQFLNATRETRTVITDPKALYFGIAVNDQSPTLGHNPPRPDAFFGLALPTS